MMQASENKTNTTPLISVIVPVYNSADYLPQCVDALLQQSFPEFELILVDDGSTDFSGAACDGYAAADSRVKVIHQENQGQSAARNRGIDESSGQYLAFVDSDDYVTEDYLRYLLELLKENANCSFSACNWFVVRKGKPKLAFQADSPTHFSREEAFHSVLYHGAVDVSSWGKLFRKELFSDICFPEGRIYEDTWVFGEILNASENIVVGNEAKYYYVQHDASTVNGGFSPKRLTYIDAVEKLTREAKKCSGSLNQACTRRMTHAYLSVLRYMENCPSEYINERNELRKKILFNSKIVLSDRNTPRRDKIAILSLKPGLRFFFILWRIYNKKRA